ncbi:hypothetical protein KI387_002645, partial [Taxus chinensis]
MVNIPLLYTPCTCPVRTLGPRPPALSLPAPPALCTQPSTRASLRPPRMVKRRHGSQPSTRTSLRPPWMVTRRHDGHG